MQRGKQRIEWEMGIVRDGYQSMMSTRIKTIASLLRNKGYI